MRHFSGMPRLLLTVDRRAKRTPDLSLGTHARGLTKAATDARTRLGPIADAFNQVMPDRLASQCSLELVGGTLNVLAPNASVGYRARQVLRAGGDLTIKRASPGRLSRIKVAIDKSPNTKQNATNS